MTLIDLKLLTRKEIKDKSAVLSIYDLLFREAEFPHGKAKHTVGGLPVLWSVTQTRLYTGTSKLQRHRHDSAKDSVK